LLSGADGSSSTFCRPSKQETTMTKSTSRLVRLGSARTLTRAVSRGEFDELNPVLKYTIPPSE